MILSAARAKYWRRTLLLALLLSSIPVEVSAQKRLPAASLAVRKSDRWHTWWKARAAPARWTSANPAVTGAVQWRRIHNGVESGELELAGDGTAWRVRVILVRFDPSEYQLTLRQVVRDAGLGGAWEVDSASTDATVAFNAGQFTAGTPWGWLVQGGREIQPPGRGPLSMALVVDSVGAVSLLTPTEMMDARGKGGIAEAFQSYPTLLVDGAVPHSLRRGGRGIDVQHRDARLAICKLREDKLLVALTRFGGLGGALERLPVGPTTPEMAAVMGALGCTRAMMLDGGLSSQLMLRSEDGSTNRWPGLRRVPLALEVMPRVCRIQTKTADPEICGF